MFRLGYMIDRHALSCSFVHRRMVGRPQHQAVCRRSSRGQRSTARRCAYAMVIPGDSAVELVVLSGTITFLNIYQNLLVARVILSWFPAASQVSLLQPLYVVCDPFLRVFQGILPPIAGIDFSPILGFTLLQMGTRLTAALSMECKEER